MKIPSSIINRLSRRKQEEAYRELMLQGNLVDFFSNDYLGVAKLPFDGHLQYGSTGSRLISGNTKFTERLESYLANFFGHEAGLLFNSGYDANLGFYSCVPQRGDTVLYDEFIHASIRDGIRLSHAKSIAFRHNDLKSLKEKIKFAEGTVYIAVESVYSMDGDMAPLDLLAEIAHACGAYLVVDEAHAGGIFGEGGSGLVTSNNLDLSVFCKLITFGKAYGSHGAILLGPAELRSYLINFSRPFIYTTALPLHAQERIEFAVNQVAKMESDREKLFRNIRFFRDLIYAKNIKCIDSLSAIQSVIISGNSNAKK